MGKLNHSCPAQWVLCPLLSNPKCMHFAQWTLRKPWHTVKEQNLSLKTEACLRLLSRALGLWIPFVQAGSLCRAPVSPTIPPGCHIDCGHPCPCGPHSPLHTQYSWLGPLPWAYGLLFTQSLEWHPDAQPLGVLVPKRIRKPFHMSEIQRQV